MTPSTFRLVPYKPHFLFSRKNEGRVTTSAIEEPQQEVVEFMLKTTFLITQNRRSFVFFQAASCSLVHIHQNKLKCFAQPQKIVS